MTSDSSTSGKGRLDAAVYLFEINEVNTTDKATIKSLLGVPCLDEHRTAWWKPWAKHINRLVLCAICSPHLPAIEIASLDDPTSSRPMLNAHSQLRACVTQDTAVEVIAKHAR